MKNIQLKSFANGTINLKEKSIELNDISSRMNMGIFKISPFVFLFFGVHLIYTGIIAESQVQLILRILSGIILVSIPVLLYHSNFIRTNKKEIELNEIKNVEVKKVFGEILIDFKLKDKSTRRVHNVKNMSDWRLIKSHLVERKISCLN
jgi:hypothetical protein